MPQSRRVLSLARWLSLIFLGGACGTMLRAALERFALADGASVWLVLVINVVGSFILGMVLELVSAVADHRWRQAVRLVVGTGFLGGLTTYSTFMLQTTEYLRTGEVVLAGSYLLGTVLGGLGAALAGITIGAWVRHRVHGARLTGGGAR